MEGIWPNHYYFILFIFLHWQLSLLVKAQSPTVTVTVTPTTQQQASDLLSQIFRHCPRLFLTKKNKESQLEPLIFCS